MIKKVATWIILLLIAAAGVWYLFTQSPAAGTLAALRQELFHSKTTTEPVENQDNTAVLPRNVLQIGDSFEYYPGKADGRLRCKVTDAWMLAGEVDCPAPEFFDEPLATVINGEQFIFEYEDWFAEGGAFELGCRIAMVDLEITNIDAVAWLDSSDVNKGFFEDPYAFYADGIVTLANLKDLIDINGHFSYRNRSSDYYSLYGQYSEDDLNTMGSEYYAVQILPGETVKYTLGFYVPTDGYGNPRDPAMLWLCVGAYSSTEEGVFVDLKLGDSKT